MRGMQVLPGHYAIVHDNLLASVGELFGEAITPDVAAGWSEAVNHLSGILIDREEELYQEAEARAGGWRGWKQFVVSHRLEHVVENGQEAVVSWSF